VSGTAVRVDRGDHLRVDRGTHAGGVPFAAHLFHFRVRAPAQPALIAPIHGVDVEPVQPVEHRIICGAQEVTPTHRAASNEILHEQDAGVGTDQRVVDVEEGSGVHGAKLGVQGFGGSRVEDDWGECQTEGSGPSQRRGVRTWQPAATQRGAGHRCRPQGRAMERTPAAGPYSGICSAVSRPTSPRHQAQSASRPRRRSQLSMPLYQRMPISRACGLREAILNHSGQVRP